MGVSGIHHGGLLVRSQTALEAFVVGAVICLEPIVEDDIAIAAGAVWHVVEGRRVLLGNNCYSRLRLHVIETGPRLGPLVEAKFVKAAVPHRHVRVAPCTVSRIRHVLWVVCAIDCGT